MKLLTLKAVSERLGVSESTILRMAEANELPGRVQIHKRLRYREDALEAWILAGGSQVSSDAPRAA